MHEEIDKVGRCYQQQTPNIINKKLTNFVQYYTEELHLARVGTRRASCMYFTVREAVGMTTHYSAVGFYSLSSSKLSLEREAF